LSIIGDVERGMVTDGGAELRARAQELAERLPGELAPFARLAFNYRWSWLPGGPELFAALDAERFERCLQNPVRLLQELSGDAIRQACADDGLLARAAELEAQVQADLERPFDERIDPARPVAFLCAEYGVHVSLPVYSGGLGALAGDLLKEASDCAIPLVAVGLMYRKGYFRQRIDAGGWQHEYWVDTDPEREPAALVRGADGEPLTVCVPIYGRPVTARIWRVDVGRVPLFLLDSDVPENGPHERWVTARLYESDSQTRLAQYVLLGSGGVRALRALGIEPGVIHMNEGHPALAPVELAGAATRGGASLEDALAEARSRTVFTTHTPVPAGNDSYPADQVHEAVAEVLAQLSMPDEDWLALGRTNPGDPHEPFGVTQAALRMSRAANAVSRRHGEVARDMWNVLWPARGADEVPIGYVTNGVHVPTWVGAPMRALLDRYLGPDWMDRSADASVWARVDDIPGRELWEVRRAQRAQLVAYIARRSATDRLLRGDVHEYVDAAARVFDADTLTLGFARRVATYKRLDLLTRDPEFTFSLLAGDCPVQVVLAGKAHPRDEEAKRSLQRLFGLKYARVIAERVVFLDDYDLSSAALLVRGCDVWMNLPRPPLEASGTSGMKSVINGGLQLSVLDGWWAEGFDGSNGWGLPGDVDHDHHAQDARDAQAFNSALADEVVPLYYERDGEGIPAGWLAKVRASLRTLGPRFSATRMLNEYVDGPYRGGA
jgi:glycogen phosphorylase